MLGSPYLSGERHGTFLRERLQKGPGVFLKLFFEEHPLHESRAVP